MTDPINDDARRARRSREALYRQMLNEAEEKPKDSSSCGTLKGRPVKHADTSDKSVGNVFRRVTGKH